jgi:hypothetical protein
MMKYRAAKATPRSLDENSPVRLEARATASVTDQLEGHLSTFDASAVSLRWQAPYVPPLPGVSALRLGL